MLKGEKKRPTFNASMLDKEAGKQADEQEKGTEGNAWFAWFQTTVSKSRINFLQLLRAQHTDYRTNAQALAYMRQKRRPQPPLQRLLGHPCQHFPDHEQ